MNYIKTCTFVVVTMAIITLNTHSVFSQDSRYKSIIAREAPNQEEVNNPIIQGLGVCDPHIHIFDDKAYLFASHDRAPGAKFYGMYDWWIWSSSDLVNWELEFTLFPKNMWVGPTNNCWAVEGAVRNGKHYFYVSGNWRTGVAVSNDGPGGPYKDALKKSIDGVKYDPTVFIDDDENQTPYLITGGYPYKIAQLEEDMMTLAEEPKELVYTTEAWDGDGGFLHKRNGIYYVNGHGSDYATSENIYGPYTYRGRFYPTWIDHPTFFEWNNQTFCAFGRGDVDRFFRKTHITYVHYKDNGDIVACQEVGDSFIGVGQYDCSRKIEAEWYFAASDGTEKKETESGFAVTNMTNGAYLYYPRIFNIAENSIIDISFSSANSGGIIEVRKDKPNGELLGKIDLPNTGSLTTYRTVTTKLENEEGLTNIYLVYKGKSDASATIDWFTLSSTGAIQEPEKPEPLILAYEATSSTPSVSAFSQIEAEDLIEYNVLRTNNTSDQGSGRCLTNLKNKSYSSYKIDFGSRADNALTFQARLASNQHGSIEIRLDDEKGTLLGTCEFENTGGLNKWVTKECKINAPAGVQHVFLVYRGEEEEKYSNATQILHFNWFSFKE